MGPGDLGGRGSTLEVRRSFKEETVELKSGGCSWGKPEESSGTARARPGQWARASGTCEVKSRPGRHDVMGANFCDGIRAACTEQPSVPCGT